MMFLVWLTNGFYRAQQFLYASEKVEYQRSGADIVPVGQAYYDRCSSSWGTVCALNIYINVVSCCTINSIILHVLISDNTMP